MSNENLRAHADVLREALEAMLLRLDVRGGNPRAVEALQSSVRSLSLFARLDVDDPAALAEIETTKEALQKLRASEPSDDDDILDEADAWIRGIRNELGGRAVSATRARPEATDGARVAVPFVASAGAPALFDGVDVPPPELIPVDDRWAAYEEEPKEPPRHKLGAPQPTRERAHLELLARDLMEDLATLGGLRRSVGYEAWGEAEGFEKRLLANLDALVSLERPVRPDVAKLGLVRHLYRYATEWWVPDGGRSFAFAFTLACLASEPAMEWIVLGAQRAPERTLHAFANALSLGSSPAIPSAIKALLATESPPLILVALEVARRRRFFHVSMLALLAHPNLEIAEQAVGALLCAPRPTALEALSSVLIQDSPTRMRVSAAAAEVLATLGDPRGIPVARDLLGRALAQTEPTAGLTALRIVALHGDPKDADAVQRAAIALPGGLPLLGFFGSPEHALAIVEQLRDPERVGEAENALYRLTGIRFESPYDVDALASRVKGRVKEWSGRIRHGAPHTPAVVMKELLSPTTPQHDRRTLAIEVGMIAREPIAVDLDGWVARQRADLQALAAAIGQR